MPRGLLELYFLIVLDVGPPALREPVHKERSVPAPNKNNGPVAFRPSLTGLGDPLFDNLASQVGIDQAPFRPSDGLAQGDVSDPFLCGEALKPPGLVDAHGAPFILWHQVPYIQGLALFCRVRMPSLSQQAARMPHVGQDEHRGGDPAHDDEGKTR